MHPELRLTMPRADTPAGWITFGFYPDLNEATSQATVEMIHLMGEVYGLRVKEALALASVVVDLRITQIINGVKGVHAILPHHAIEKVAADSDREGIAARSAKNDVEPLK